MKRRSKENIRYWNGRLKAMFIKFPETKKVEKRYEALKGLLQKKYDPIMESVSHETLLQFLRDTVYLDRKLRLETEGYQQEKKKILSQEYQLENGYEVGYYQDIKNNND